jgi:hypothetical protein
VLPGGNCIISAAVAVLPPVEKITLVRGSKFARCALMPEKPRDGEARSVPAHMSFVAPWRSALDVMDGIKSVEDGVEPSTCWRSWKLGSEEVEASLKVEGKSIEGGALESSSGGEGDGAPAAAVAKTPAWRAGTAHAERGDVHAGMALPLSMPWPSGCEGMAMLEMRSEMGQDRNLRLSSCCASC